MRVAAFLLIAAAGVPGIAEGQQSPIEGTWRVEARLDTKGGPREVVIRSDSSATWGKETSRWRLDGKRISIAIGGEWEVYDVKIGKSELTLSGGDLQKPITLKRIGPPTPRPAGMAVPPDPDSEI
ncbi:MAG TPA: hypothetical protein VFT04_06425 [Gemmatimonadales bacterium]|nr:hypothetical protein [Gemmatimonadales bacterium]